MNLDENYLLSTITQYFYWFFTLNILFILTNCLFVVALILLQLHLNNSFYFFLTLLPFGASMVALLSCLNKIVVEKDLRALKDFGYYYHKFFTKSSLIWGGISSLIFIMMNSINYVRNTPFFMILAPPNIILLFLFINMLICSLTLITKSNSRLEDILKLSFYVSIRKGYVTLLNEGLFLIWLFVVFVKPVFGFGILPSIICFLIIKNNELVSVKFRNDENREGE